jgi:hypothetical protein
MVKKELNFLQMMLSLPCGRRFARDLQANLFPTPPNLLPRLFQN